MADMANMMTSLTPSAVLLSRPLFFVSLITAATGSPGCSSCAYICSSWKSSDVIVEPADVFPAWLAQTTAHQHEFMLTGIATGRNDSTGKTHATSFAWERVPTNQQLCTYWLLQFALYIHGSSLVITSKTTKTTTSSITTYLWLHQTQI